MSEWDRELEKALLLVRDFRLKSMNIDPRATRVALKYMLMVDGYLARKRGLTDAQDAELTKVAWDLFMKTPQIRRILLNERERG